MPFYKGEISEDKKQEYNRDLSNYIGGLPEDEFLKFFRDIIAHHADNDTVDDANRLIRDIETGDAAQKNVLRYAATNNIGAVLTRGDTGQVFLLKASDKEKYGFRASGEENRPPESPNSRRRGRFA